MGPGNARIYLKSLVEVNQAIVYQTKGTTRICQCFNILICRVDIFVGMENRNQGRQNPVKREITKLFKNIRNIFVQAGTELCQTQIYSV